MRRRSVVIVVLMKLFAPPAQQHAAAANGLTAIRLREMIRASRPRRGLAKIDQLGLQAFDLETNGAAAGEGQRHDAGRRIVLGEFDRQQIERRVLVGLIEIAALAAVHALEPQRRAAAPQIGRRTSVAGRTQSKRLSAITKRCSRGRQKMSATLTSGVLHVGRNHLDVVLVERDELQLLHTRSVPGFRVFSPMRDMHARAKA